MLETKLLRINSILLTSRRVSLRWVGLPSSNYELWLNEYSEFTFMSSLAQWPQDMCWHGSSFWNCRTTAAQIEA